MKTYFPGTHKLSILGVWTAPGGPISHSKKAGRFAPRLLEWFLGPPGLSRSPKSMISGSREIGFHDYINTKWGLHIDRSGRPADRWICIYPGAVSYGYTHIACEAALAPRLAMPRAQATTLVGTTL